MRELGLILALVAIVLGVAAREPRFLSITNVRQILVSVAILAVVAAGQTLVILTRNVDLSVASIVGLVAFVVRDLLADRPGLGVAGALAIGCALGMVLGALNGALVTVGEVPAIVATLGTMYVYRGLDFWYAGGRQVTAGDTPDAFRQLARSQPLGIPTPVLIAAAVVLVTGYLLRVARFGRYLYAVGSNPEAARLAGLPRDRIVFGAFVASGLLCG
ncbi:MAG: ABC transporter permease, partial [Chloroflexia bacterium]|nr:ABC transporter permease [Chloroflexia bacterium]